MKSNTEGVGPGHKSHYWDHRFQRKTIKLLPGDYEVVSGNQMLVTVLGSCVAACMRDRKLKIGGMNHFLLPTDHKITDPNWEADPYSPAARYGDFAMEQLINQIIAKGGQRENLEVKIFGGANMFNNGMSDIGGQNVQFITDYLKIERIKLIKADTGGQHARKVYYIPQTGDVFLKRIERVNNNTITLRETNYLKQAQKERLIDNVEFFD